MLDFLSDLIESTHINQIAFKHSTKKLGTKTFIFQNWCHEIIAQLHTIDITHGAIMQ